MTFAWDPTLQALAILFLCAQPAFAQWERLDQNAGLPEGTPGGMLFDGQTVFALWAQSAPLSVSLYASSDLGISWTPVSGFPTIVAAPTLQAVVNGRIIMASLLGNATAVAFLTSDDGGTTWTYAEHPGLGRPQFITYGNGRWYLSTASFLYVSTDDMQSWTQSSPDVRGAGVLLTDNNGSLVANRSGLAFRSADDGATWTSVSIPGNFLNYFSGAWQVGTTFYLKNAGDGMVHRSDDGGATWTSYTSFGDFNWASALVSADGATWVSYAVAVGGASYYLTTDQAVTASAAFDLTGFPISSSGTPCYGIPTLSPDYVFVSANLCFNDQNGLYRYRLSTGTATERWAEYTERPDNVRIGHLYPNPATTSVTVTHPDFTHSPLRLVDLLGRTVRTWTATSGTSATTLDLTGIPSGMYLMHSGDLTRPIVVR